MSENPPVAPEIDVELVQLGDETAQEAREFLAVIRQVASGAAPEQAIPLVLLALSQILVTGARLGAITDIVPEERFEPDLGSDFDPDTLRTDLARLFEGIDDYCHVFDPLTDTQAAVATLSGDIADVASALVQGLRHYAEGRVLEALWWWQFSYLSDWGSRGGAAMRAVLSILSHIRLDTDADTAAEAEFDALHS